MFRKSYSLPSTAAALLLLLLLSLSPSTLAFQPAARSLSARRTTKTTNNISSRTPVRSATTTSRNQNDGQDQSTITAPSPPSSSPSPVIPTVSTIAATAALCLSLTLVTPLSAHADSTTDTVQATLNALQQSRGDASKTLQAYETLADIITEGTGVGGSINYQGVNLERGYVADEDTTIYNPGLTLLTESEKTQLIQAVIDAKKSTLQSNQWTDDLELGYDYLKQRLDPLHMVELEGYLAVLPIYGAVVYGVVLAVQQFLRDLFPAAYLIGVAAVFGPVAVLVAAGPQ